MEKIPFREDINKYVQVKPKIDAASQRYQQGKEFIENFIKGKKSQGEFRPEDVDELITLNERLESLKTSSDRLQAEHKELIENIVNGLRFLPPGEKVCFTLDRAKHAVWLNDKDELQADF